MAARKSLPLHILSLVLVVYAFSIVASGTETTTGDIPGNTDPSYEDFKAWGNRDNAAPSATFDEKDVLVLTGTNFSASVNNETKYVMVQFYAPWCEYCQALAPEYAAAATELKEAGFDVVLAKVDAISETELADHYKVDVFPAIYFFTDGQHKLYEGERNKDAIISWLKKKTGFSVQNVTSTEQAAKILAAESKIVMAFFDSLTGSESQELHAAAKVEDYVNFYQTISPDVAKMFEIDPNAKRPALVLLKDEPEKVSVFDGSFLESAIIDFVSTNKHPLVIKFSRDNVEVVFDDPLRKQMLLFAPGKESSNLVQTFQETAIAFKDKLVFVYVDTDNEDYGKAMVDHFGIVGDPTRVVAYAGHLDGRKFLMDGDITLENTKTFAESLLADKLQPFLKSDPVPETNDGDVKVVVGKNFEEIVLDESKDVLLEIYAPWCPYCHKMEPVYNQLGKHMRGVDSITIAKMDGTRNEHSKAKFDGYPAFLFFSAGKKSSDPIVVDVDGTEVELYNFLKKHASTLFTIDELEKPKETLKTVTSSETIPRSHEYKDEL